MIKYDENEVRVNGEDLSEVWWRGRQWAVTEYGLERRNGTYALEAKRLCGDHKNNYSSILHMGEKNWVDVDDFTTAFFIACAMHGKRLTAAEREMLLKHHVKAKYEERLRPYYEKARIALGIQTGPGAMFQIVSVRQLSEICDKAVELEKIARQDLKEAA
jgi:hypothetical protein